MTMTIKFPKKGTTEANVIAKIICDMRAQQKRCVAYSTSIDMDGDKVAYTFDHVNATDIANAIADMTAAVRGASFDINVIIDQQKG